MSVCGVIGDDRGSAIWHLPNRIASGGLTPISRRSRGGGGAAKHHNRLTATHERVVNLMMIDLEGHQLLMDMSSHANHFSTLRSGVCQVTLGGASTSLYCEGRLQCSSPSTEATAKVP